ncbi:MAG TPA: TlpA disulfide reductase family protein [Bacteroidales bacterium]|nr:TlpA disulfide reductase family protein [Bacteroidales bacterium]
MKAILKLIFSILFLGLFALILYGLVTRISRKSVTSKNIQHLPLFSFSTLNGQTFNSSEIKEGPVILVYFNPECDHCQFQIEELSHNLDSFPGLKIILVSPADRDLVSVFLEGRFKNPGLNVTVLFDDSLKFESCFGKQSVPSLFIYDKKLRLVRLFNGEVKSETLTKYLEDVNCN